jgi:hypothetical protein
MHASARRPLRTDKPIISQINLNNLNNPNSTNKNNINNSQKANQNNKIGNCPSTKSNVDINFSKRANSVDAAENGIVASTVAISNSGNESSHSSATSSQENNLATDSESSSNKKQLNEFIIDVGIGAGLNVVGLNGAVGNVRPCETINLKSYDCNLLLDINPSCIAGSIVGSQRHSPLNYAALALQSHSNTRSSSTTSSKQPPLMMIKSNNQYNPYQQQQQQLLQQHIASMRRKEYYTIAGRTQQQSRQFSKYYYQQVGTFLTQYKIRENYKFLQMISVPPLDPAVPRPEGGASVPACGEPLLVPASFPQSIEAAVHKFANASSKATCISVLDQYGKPINSLTYGMLKRLCFTVIFRY